MGGLKVAFSVSRSTGYIALIWNFPCLLVLVVNWVPGSGNITLALGIGIFW